MKRKPKVGDLVQVEWEDAVQMPNGGKAYSIEEQATYEPHVTWSNGWLMRTDRKCVVIALHRDTVGYRDTLQVPRGMVKGVKVLR